MMDDERQLHDDVRSEHREAADPSPGENPGQPAEVTEPTSAGAHRGRRARKSRMSFLTEMVVLFVVALAIALLIKTFVVQPFFIPSRSMEDTLLVGDKVLVNKLVYDFRPIARGDIIVFNGDGSWNPPASTSSASHNPIVRAYDATLLPLFRDIEGLFGAEPGQTDYIKRVIGLPGDHVVCCNAQGQITVNGVALHEQSFLYPGARPSLGRFNIVVPPGRLWVMGDNRLVSADSRYHDCAYHQPGASITCVPYDRNGTIPESAVIGRAFMIIWPPNRIRILPIPATFNQPGLNRAAAMASTALPGPAAAAAGLPVVPSRPYLPLTAGFAAAIPMTLLERRLRLRLTRRRNRPGRRLRGPRR